MRENKAPDGFTAFPEEERLRDGTMREEIMAMVVEALNAQGYPELSIDTIRSELAHRKAAVELLRDCRPLPVVLALIEELENGRFVTP